MTRSWLLGLVALAAGSPSAHAAAPPRAVPYDEAICASDPEVFFCEDFEGNDIRVSGAVGDPANFWLNPAIESWDLFWSTGGSHQRSTEPLIGFDPAVNHVWRISKTADFTDIVTGLNTGTGAGQLQGWLEPAILGAGAREWYTRVQVWFSPDHLWPANLDYKVFYALPRDFPDPPSADYEAGIYFSEDISCLVGGSWTSAGGDVLGIRYGPSFSTVPELGDYCPWLASGLPADGLHMPQIVRERWYSFEYHVRLASSPTANDGLLELWVDGDLAYRYESWSTCSGGCPDLGFIMILGWMNAADPQAGYAEYDNVVMSRSYIGLPGPAAEIFNDGFESGSFSAWPGSVGGGG